METADDLFSALISITAFDLEWRLKDAIENDRHDEVRTMLDSEDDLLELPLQHKLGKGIIDASPLILAAILDKPSIIRLLLENGANADAEVSDLGATALHMAARFGSKESVDLLLSQRVDVNRRDRYGSSPLHLASQFNRHEIVACILDAQADLSQRDNADNTPFHYASMSGSREKLLLLWERGPKEQIKELNKYQNTPLHLACSRNHPEIVELLLDWGADIDQSGPDGETPLFAACAGGNDKIIEMLIRRDANIHARNSYGETPILCSCRAAQSNTLRPLIEHGASVLDVDQDGDNCFHKASFALRSQDSFDISMMFTTLANNQTNIDHTNKRGHSPLHLACIMQKFEHVKCLLDLGADVNLKNHRNGFSALMQACAYPDIRIVQLLLQRGADITSTNKNGETALMIACDNNQLEHVKTLIQHNEAVVAVWDKWGHTPLSSAVARGHIDIALEILATTIYFPLQPAQEKAFTERTCSPERIVLRIEEGLLKSLENNRDYKLEQLQAILHWAIANGSIQLAQCCIFHNAQVLQLERSGATWLHVAAQYGDHEFIKHLQFMTDPLGTTVGQIYAGSADILAVAEGQITALHVAAVNHSVRTVEILLSMITDPLTRAEAIISRNSYGESPLSISIQQKHKGQQELFWKEFRRLETTGRSFMDSHRVLGTKVLEQLAKYEIPGHEDVLKELLQKWFRDEPPRNHQDFTTLHWAVYRSQAVVVWWLLSKGGYSSGYTIENALNLVPSPKYAHNDARYYIRELLLHPPQLIDQVANPNTEHITSKPALMDDSNPSLSLQGNIVDIYTAGETISIPYTKASVRDIIYEKGPEYLMKNSGENWEENSLDELKRTLERATHDASDPPSPSPGTFESAQNRTVGAFMLRWIHLPVNELHLMRDLVFRLSHDSKRLEIDHAFLMKHFDRSWTQLTAGGRRSYMKPQCVWKDNHEPSNDLDDDWSRSQLSEDMISCTALYLPYLTIGNIDRSQGPETSVNPNNPRQIKHEPMTLDQYYYPTITNTHKRDQDQVLSKFLEKNGRQEKRKILMVNQLWMWIIDESITPVSPVSPDSRISKLIPRYPETIITATDEAFKEKCSENEDLFDTTLHKLLYEQTTRRFDRAISVWSVRELILGIASGLFKKESLVIPEQPTERKGPIDIFRESIRNVADEETELFQEFLRGLRQEEMRRSGVRDKGSQHSDRNKKKDYQNGDRPPNNDKVSQNRYHIISSETKLLETTRDIRDELHILKSLADDQDVVWNQAFPQNGRGDRFQYHHSSIPEDVKKEINDMLSEAEQTTNYITTLLDLRRAEHNRIEASESARLSQDLASQSKSIFIFTVVTIVFLPLSFLSSLFALDVTVFPHDESGDLKYPGWWLFPILFGVTIIVSFPTIALAWNVNAILGRFRLGTRRDSTETAPSIERRSDVLAQLGESLLRRRGRPDRNNPSYV